MESSPSPQSLSVLIVEDNPDHLFLARKAIQGELGGNVQLRSASSGEEALALLEDLLKNATAALPDLLLVDLQLPGRDGFWLIRTLKSDHRLRVIPVIIFTSSDADGDIRRGYEAGGNVYVCKGAGPDEFAGRLREIRGFWSRVALLPPHPEETESVR